MSKMSIPDTSSIGEPSHQASNQPGDVPASTLLPGPISLRIYHERGKPRDGASLVVDGTPRPATSQNGEPSGFSLCVTGSQIHNALRQASVDLSRFTPTTYSKAARAHIPVPDISNRLFPANVTTRKGQPRIDVRLVDATSPPPGMLEMATATDISGSDAVVQNGKGKANANGNSQERTTVAQSKQQEQVEQQQQQVEREYTEYFVSAWCGVGVARGKGTPSSGIWRAAQALGAAFTFTVNVGKDTSNEESAASSRAARATPQFSFPNVNSFSAAAPNDAQWVVVGRGGTDLREFKHPRRALYILASEDGSGELPDEILQRAHFHVAPLPEMGRPLLTGASSVAAIVLWDRALKMSVMSSQKQLDEDISPGRQKSGAFIHRSTSTSTAITESAMSGSPTPTLSS